MAKARVGASSQRGYVLALVIVLALVLGSTVLLVNTNLSSSRELGERGDASDALGYVTEAAINHTLWVLEHSNCAAVAAISNVPFGDHSYSAEISPAGSSPVRIVVTAQGADGITRALSRDNVRVFQQVSNTVVLNPVADTYLSSDNPDQNNNSALWVTTNSSSDIRTQRGLMRFDISGIPPAATVTNAELSLFQTRDFGNPDELEVHRLTRDWVEAAVTWNSYDGVNPWASPGGDYDADIAGSFIATGSGRHAFPITALVQAWVAGGNANQGLLLRSPPFPGNNQKDFSSMNQTNASRYPELLVNYYLRCECGSVC